MLTIVDLCKYTSGHCVCNLFFFDVFFKFVKILFQHSRADPGAGGGGPVGQDPSFGGPSKLHKEGENVARVCAKTLHFST